MSTQLPPDDVNDVNKAISPEDEKYLWDGTGEPAADVRRVEAALGTMRYSGELRAPRRLHVPRRLMIAASLLLVIVTSYMLFGRGGPGGRVPGPTPPVVTVKPTWTVASTQGDVKVGEPRDLTPTVKLRDVTVGKDGRVTLRSGEGSTVQVESEARLEIAEAANQFPWVKLSSGNAFVQVAGGDKPIMVGLYGHAVSMQPGAAASFDAGAEKTVLTCKTGEAHISWPQQSTRVLGPAVCTIEPGRGPALPLPVAAPKEACGVIDALGDSLHFGMKDLKGGSMLLKGYLDNVTAADAPTLWNLLNRVPDELRRPVRDRLAQLIAPVKVDPELILKLDPAAMDAWWRASVEASQQN